MNKRIDFPKQPSEEVKEEANLEKVLKDPVVAKEFQEFQKEFIQSGEEGICQKLFALFLYAKDCHAINSSFCDGFESMEKEIEALKREVKKLKKALKAVNAKP